jgi:NTE family protein
MVDHLKGPAQIDGVSESASRIGKWLGGIRRWSRAEPLPPPSRPHSVGLALGGGFARGIAHVGVLRVFEKYDIPIHAIAGVSAGGIVAAAYASGASTDEIGKAGSEMRFTDVARWSISKMGLAGSDRMEGFLLKLLKHYQFEEMKIPLGIVATNLSNGDSVLFRDHGDVKMPVRASCSYPGLFQPIHYQDKLLVDGAMSIEIPAPSLREMGATFVASVHLPMQHAASPGPSNLFQVINRCFQIMQTRMEDDWRRHSDVVIVPDVSGMEWDCFGSAEKLIQAGEIAALEAVPKIKAWLANSAVTTGLAAASRSPSGSSPARALSRISTARDGAGSPVRRHPPESPG